MLSITQNPHTKDPELLWKALEGKKLDGYELDENATLDKEGFERLKFLMAENPKIIIKS